MIFINDIPSFRNPDNHDGRNIDDRKTKVPLINGTHIQNAGKFFGSIPVTCVFTQANFDRFMNLWLSDETVSYTDKTGKTFSGLTIKLNSYNYVDKFETYVSVNFELLKAEYGRSVSFG